MTQELQTAIVGATGYAGQELARILFQHPRLKPPVLLAREGEEAGEIASPVDGSPVPVHPFSWSIMHKKGVDLLFLATPHEVSRAWVPMAMAHGLRVIDLSGAWRLHAPENAAVYGFEDAGSAAATALMAKTVYGLPELWGKKLPDAQLVANPGCYPTSVILALAPLIEAGPGRDARHHLRLEVRSVRRGQKAQREDALRRDGGELPRVFCIHPSPHRRDPRAVATETA